MSLPKLESVISSENHPPSFGRLFWSSTIEVAALVVAVTIFASTFFI